MKICARCKIELPLQAFNKYKKAKDGLKHSCRECTKTYNKTVLKDWKTAYDKNYRETKMTDKQRDSKREYMRIYQREYTKKYPERNCAHVSRRRAMEHGATPNWANSEVVNDFYKRASAWSKLSGENWEVDHIVPLKSKIVCGLHCEQNLTIVEASKNRSKGNRWWPDMPEPEPLK